MAGRGTKSTQRTRTETERARVYAARTAWHEGQLRRRIRDNAVVGVAGGLLIVCAVVSQFVHAQVTAPEPAPTETSTPAPAVTLPPVQTPAPGETPTE